MAVSLISVVEKSVKFSFVSHPLTPAHAVTCGNTEAFGMALGSIGPLHSFTRLLFLVCGGERFTLFLEGASPGVTPGLGAAPHLLPIVSLNVAKPDGWVAWSGWRELRLLGRCGPASCCASPEACWVCLWQAVPVRNP